MDSNITFNGEQISKEVLCGIIHPTKMGKQIREILHVINHVDTQIRKDANEELYIRVQGYMSMEDFQNLVKYEGGISIDSVSWRDNQMYISTWIIEPFMLQQQ